MTERTPDEHVIELPYDVGAAGLARRFVAEHTGSLPAQLAADAELIVSELVTNAYLHGKPSISMRVNLDPPLIGISVQDAGELVPSTNPSEPPVDATHGRGLVIVDQLASNWGIDSTAPGAGKSVWFHIAPALDAD